MEKKVASGEAKHVGAPNKHDETGISVSMVTVERNLKESTFLHLLISQNKTATITPN
jgi:hypothetical protein